MNKCLPLILALVIICVVQPASAQFRSEASIAKKIDDVYQVPFASSGNKIELAIANIGDQELSSIEILASTVPGWISLVQQEAVVSSIDAENEVSVVFEFAVDREAPVNEAEPISFVIRSAQGQLGRKEFLLAVQAPQDIVLYQNFPNPASGETTIGFDVPDTENVRIEIYDLLGRQKVLLVDEAKSAGHYKVTWNTGGMASGVYFYVLSAVGQDGQHTMLQKKLILY